MAEIIDLAKIRAERIDDLLGNGEPEVTIDSISHQVHARLGAEKRGRLADAFLEWEYDLNNPEKIITCADALSNNGFQREARGLVKKLLTHDPQNADAYSFLADDYFHELGDDVKAEKCYQKAIAFAPENIPDYIDYGVHFLMEHRGDYRKAQEVLRIGFETTNATVLQAHIGRCLFHTGQYESAIQLSKGLIEAKGVEITPEDRSEMVTALGTLERVYTALGQSELFKPYETLAEQVRGGISEIDVIIRLL